MIVPTEIKHPLAVLSQGEDSETFSVWWEQFDGKVVFFDCIPENYPVYTLGFFESKEEAIQRLKEMTGNEGWIIVGGEIQATWSG